MKTFRTLAFYLLVTCNLAVYSQDTIRYPVSSKAFDKNIMQDINFMVLGDNNPKQGVSYEYDEKKTELSLSGVLSAGKTNLWTVDGSFAVDDGVFIFDSKDGSKKGTVTVNWFRSTRFSNSKKYPGARTDAKNYNAEANRKRYINNFIEKEIPRNTLDSLRVLDTIMHRLNLPVSQKKAGHFSRLDDKSYRLKHTGVKKDTAGYDTRLKNKLLKYYKNPAGKKYKNSKQIFQDMQEGNQDIILLADKKDSVRYNKPSGLDVKKLFEDYDKALQKADSIDEKVYDSQISNFKDIWTKEHNTYFGVSSYYERESLDLYNSSINEFSKRFEQTVGDLYGIKGNLTTVYRWPAGSFLMLRGLATFGRASNFSEFKKKDYVYNSAPETIGTGIVVEEQKKTGYYSENNQSYSYGFIQKYTGEIYISSKVGGLYGKIGYSKNDALIDKETYPMETGILLNVKSEKKNVVSIIIFVSRLDLKTHPDDDTNFGFKIGLPINVRKSEKKQEKE